MSDRAFPVVYARDVPSIVGFYERLGFTVTFRHPPDDEQGYVSMQRGDHTLGMVTVASPKQLAGVDVGTEPRFEMFVYVDNVDATVEDLRASGITILREPADMPWGERLSYVTDPEGNPVALANTITQ